MTVRTSAGQCLVLHGIDWPTYLGLLRILRRPGIRLTYDHGTLEIMILTYQHESWGHLLGRMILVLTEELHLPVAGGGSTTFRRRRRKRGLEPDECYWIAHEPDVRGKTRIDLSRDPPPDLAVEVDITHSSLNRLNIYSALGVPEVWRFDGQSVIFHLLGSEGQYAAAAHSGIFPLVTPVDVLRFLTLRGQLDENSMIRQFRAWVQSVLPTGGAVPAIP